MSIAAALLVVSAHWTCAAANAGPLTPTCGVGALTASDRRSFALTEQSITADGARVAYLSYLAGFGTSIKDRLYVQDTRTLVATRINSPALRGNLGAPVISADGSQVAFSAARPVPSGEVFIYDVARRTIRQITPDDDGMNAHPVSISADGSKILYSMGDSPPASGAIVVHDLVTGEDTTVVTTAEHPALFVGPESMALSPDGSRVVFVSASDPDANHELFLADVGTHTITQLTHTAPAAAAGRDNTHPRFIHGGATIVFSSQGDITGPNPDGSYHTFLYDLADQSFTPLTALGPEGVISDSGTRITFTTDTDPLGTNPDHNDEVFSYHVPSDTITHLTDSPKAGPGGSYGPDTPSGPRGMSANGTVVAFNTRTNYGATNPDHSEDLYLATTCGPAPTPDALLAVGTGPYVGDDVYSSAPRPTQEQAATVTSGGTRRFTARIQNDRQVADRMTIRGADTGSPGYQVTYRRNGADLTGAIRAGTYRTPVLAPGEAITISIEVTAGPTTTASGGRIAHLTARSATNRIARDLVTARVTRI